MERLTVFDKDLNCYVVKIKDVSDEIYSSTNEYVRFGKAIEKLAEYENAEEQGLLVRLPCKVGDTIYFAENQDNRLSAIVEEINIYKNKIQFVWYQYDYGECTEVWDSDIVTLDEMGVSWFLTEQEAEAKLKEITGD